MKCAAFLLGTMVVLIFAGSFLASTPPIYGREDAEPHGGHGAEKRRIQDKIYSSGSDVPRGSHDGGYRRPRLGASIQVLPESCSTLTTRGRSYYVCDEDYYEPADGGYMAIERPVYIDDAPDAEVGDEVRVLVDVLNVRAGPGTRYDILHQLLRGDIVPIRGENPDWYFVDLPDGGGGWIAREYVSLYRGR